MDKQEMLERQRALLEACEYLDMRCLKTTELSINTSQGKVDLESYSSLLDLVTARLSRQAIMSKRLLDKVVS